MFLLRILLNRHGCAVYSGCVTRIGIELKRNFVQFDFFFFFYSLSIIEILIIGKFYMTCRFLFADKNFMIRLHVYRYAYIYVGILMVFYIGSIDVTLYRRM